MQFLFTIILIILGVYYLFSIILRWLMPKVIKKFLAKARQNQTNQQQKQNNAQPDKHKVFKQTDGEYVDYEEVK